MPLTRCRSRSTIRRDDTTRFSPTRSTTDSASDASGLSIKCIIDSHIYTKERYGEEYQDSAYFLALKDKGIDMEEIEKELDEYAKERGIT